MVLPFLSLYLKESLDFSLAQVGTILSIFGAGSLVGSFLGGYLTDRYGSFAVQAFSLIGGGICFLILGHVSSFQGLAIGIFLTTVVTDSLRPANSTAVAEYAKPENLTKAYSLNRMAVNLGFSIGPAIGGFLAAYDYLWLFYADGLTCILAGLVFVAYFSKIQKRQERTSDEYESKASANPVKDVSFLFFMVLVAGYGVVFFQLFNTLPLYYREVYFLPENQIGWLLALNGFVVFLIEMPLVHGLGSKYAVKYIIAIGALLAGVALVMLNLTEGMLLLMLSMIVLSLSEILAMPFMTTHTVNLAPKKSRGRYLGMYSVAYSVAFIVAPALGTYIIDSRGYKFLWYIMGGIAIAVCAGILGLLKEKQAQSFESAESGMG